MEAEAREKEWVYSCGEFYCSGCGLKAAIYVGELHYCYRCGAHMAAPWEGKKDEIRK